MRLWTFLANVLADLEFTQTANDDRAYDQSGEERGQAGERGAERKIAKDAERRKVRDALSKEIEEKLKLQIAATQPTPPIPLPFPKAEAKEGPSRFRPAGEPIGSIWSDVVNPHRPKIVAEKNVFLAPGPAIWMRLIPTTDPGKVWPSYELKNCALYPAVSLTPFNFYNGHVVTLRHEDGIGICELSSPEQDETGAVAFAFETGEIWSIDTVTLAYSQNTLVMEEIEKQCTNAFDDYQRFLFSLGLRPPYQWIAGITGVKGWQLLKPVPLGMMRPFRSHTCAKEMIDAKGACDGTQSSASVLLPFFEEIYNRCGTPR